MTALIQLLEQNPYLKSVGVVLASIVVAEVIKFLLGHTIRNLAKKTRTQIDDKVVILVKKPVFWSVFLYGIYLAISLSFLLDFSLFQVKKLVLAFIYFIWAITLSKIADVVINGFGEGDTEKKESIKDIAPFLQTTSKIVIFAFLVLSILKMWEIDLTPLLASAGVMGLAFAFAAKDIIGNLFGGISVFFDKPYKVGDYVIIDDKYRGEVIHIGMRSTKIKTRDNVLITIPNSTMVTNAVINETGFDPRLRIRVPVGVSYGTNLSKVERVIKKILKAHKNVLATPKPQIRYRNFEDSSIKLEVMANIDKPANRGKVVHELIKDISKGFMEEDITIPFPQRDIHIKPTTDKESVRSIK